MKFVTVVEIVIKGVITPEKKLPKTGPETTIPVLGSLFGGILYIYKKKLAFLSGLIK